MPEDASVRILHDVLGHPPDAVFCEQPLVPLPERDGDQALVLRTVDRDENDAAVGPLRELVGGKNARLHDLAPAAPVAARELEHDRQPILLREGDRGIVVLRPLPGFRALGRGILRGGGNGNGGEKKSGEPQRKTKFHGRRCNAR